MKLSLFTAEICSLANRTEARESSFRTRSTNESKERFCEADGVGTDGFLPPKSFTVTVVLCPGCSETLWNSMVSYERVSQRTSRSPFKGNPVKIASNEIGRAHV